MNDSEFIDDRLLEKPLLSLREIKEEIKHLDYFGQFIGTFSRLAEKITPRDRQGKIRYSYFPDSDMRVDEHTKEQLRMTQDFLDEKLKN